MGGGGGVARGRCAGGFRVLSRCFRCGAYDSCAPGHPMRIEVANWSRRKIGGAESYLDLVIPSLARAGHEIGYLCEVDTPEERDPIALPDSAPIWCFADHGSPVIDRLRALRPHLILSHALADP